MTSSRLLISVGPKTAVALLLLCEASTFIGYFGLQSALALYLAHLLAHDALASGFAGAGIVDRLLCHGSCSEQPLIVVPLIVGLFGALAYVAPLAGGVIGDRVTGRARAGAVGLALMTLGYALLMSSRLLLPGLSLVILGMGCFKSNAIALLSRASDAAGADSERTFGRLYVALNVGALTAPLICGAAAWRWGWAAAFEAMAISCGLAFLFFVRAQPERFEGSPTNVDAAPVGSTPSREWRYLGGLLGLLCLTLSGNQQIYNVYLLWASARTQLSLGEWVFPPSWLVSLDSACMVGMLLLAEAISRRMAKRVRDVTSDFRRIAVGCVVVGLAFAILAVADVSASRRPIHLAWLAAFHLLNSAGFAVILPQVLATITRSMAARPSTAIGLYYLSFAAANLLAGVMGSLTAGMPATVLWSLHALLALGSGAGIAVLAARLLKARSMQGLASLATA